MKKHVLLVDDDKHNIRLFVEAFAQMDHMFKCSCAETISHAEKMLEYINPQVIFIKLDPSIIPPLEFVRNVKKQHSLRHIPIVVFSRSMGFYQSIARGHGADRCMTEPSKADEISTILHSMTMAS